MVYKKIIKGQSIFEGVRYKLCDDTYCEGLLDLSHLNVKRKSLILIWSNLLHEVIKTLNYTPTIFIKKIKIEYDSLF